MSVLLIPPVIERLFYAGGVRMVQKKIFECKNGLRPSSINSLASRRLERLTICAARFYNRPNPTQLQNQPVGANRSIR